MLTSRAACLEFWLRTVKEKKYSPLHSMSCTTCSVSALLTLSHDPYPACPPMAGAKIWSWSCPPELSNNFSGPVGASAPARPEMVMTLKLAYSYVVAEIVTVNVLFVQGYGELCPILFLQKTGALTTRGLASLSLTSHKQNGRSCDLSMLSCFDAALTKLGTPNDWILMVGDSCGAISVPSDTSGFRM